MAEIRGQLIEYKKQMILPFLLCLTEADQSYESVFLDVFRLMVEISPKLPVPGFHQIKADRHYRLLQLHLMDETY